jgi:hypothetical protein
MVDIRIGSKPKKRASSHAQGACVFGGGVIDIAADVDGGDAGDWATGVVARPLTDVFPSGGCDSAVDEGGGRCSVLVRG